ncbi:MAG: Phosphodiesterase/alkaline phosphatase D-like protein [Solirubrobacterales bacterium]|nr:Phosphodiesterase/alkaline phosphatase D-like protein [Solirubrobacterales bacterium]
MAAGNRNCLVGLTLGVLACVTLAAAPATGATAKGFKYGVAAGDVSSNSAILWAKASKSGTAEVQIVRKGRFAKCDPEDAPGKRRIKAKRSNDNTVEQKVKKLDPDTAYKFRFCMAGGKRSETGKFKTAPDSKSKQTISFALAGDQDSRPLPGEATPYWNEFEVWDRIRRQRNHFNVLLGDTIYSDTEVPGYTLADVALTVKQKRQAYKNNLKMRPWARTRGATAYYAGWDDHEFVNDFAPGENLFPLGVGDVEIDGEELYDRGVKAFTEYNPITYRKKTGIYRSVQWGKNLEIFFLDDRSFRSNGADYLGACDNPPGSGDPDVAPTAPQSTRDTFSAVVPSLADPPPPGCLATINDPSRTMLGAKQLAKFTRQVANSTATFKVIFNQVPIQQYYVLPYDRWEGYEVERQALLAELQQVKNVVFLATDVHGNLVSDARFSTLEQGGPVNSGITEVVSGPVATKSFALEISDATGVEAAGALVQSAFLKPQPPNGVGMQCAAIDQFSYAQVEVSKQQLTVDLLDINDKPVLDTGDSSVPGAQPCAQVVIPKQ